MGSGDIRSFFKPKASPNKPKTEKRPAEPAGAAAEAEPAAAERPVKKSKYFEGGSEGAGAGPSTTTAAAADPAAAAAAAAAGPSDGKKKAAAGAGRPSPAQKRARAKIIIDDSSDEDDDKGDADFKVDLTKGDDGESSDDDGGSDFAPDDDDSDDVGGRAKKRRAKASPAAMKKATPPNKPAAAAAAAAAGTKPAATPKAAPKKTPPSSKAKKSTPRAKKGAAASEPEDPATREAMAAVEEAIKALPEGEPAGFSLMAGDAAHWGGQRDEEPPNYGKKDAPRGHPDCLHGKAFVISGTLDSLRRSDAEDFIKRHGGAVRSAVSGKTSFLLVGRDCGHSKLREARNKGTKLIDEDGLFSLVAATSHLGGTPEGAAADGAGGSGAGGGLGAAPMQVDQSAAAAAVGAGAGGAGGVAVKPEPGTGAEAAATGPRPAMGAMGMGMGGGASMGGCVKAEPGVGGGGAGRSSGGPVETQLWVEKHKPRTSKELVGNPGLVNTLRHWLTEWDRVHLHGGQPTQPKGTTGKPKDLSKKAVMLSGPPGIGKTSSATILARELGFEPIEVNASDTRGKSDASASKGVGGKLANCIREVATNTSIGFAPGGARKKMCIIMDEVDGMSGNADRGGVADLIQLIHRTKVPIITICNDKYSQKLKSLRNHCLELDFRKPTRQQITKRLMEIARSEGLSMTDSTMDALVESANGDIRLLLGQLQMIRLRARSLAYDDVKGKLGASKDAEMSPFEAGRRLLDPASNAPGVSTLNDQMDWVFQDMDLVPLLVQENYINHRPNIATNEAMRLQVMAKAADAISHGDIVTRNVRQYQNWGNMPFAALIGSVCPATYMRGPREVFGLYPNEPNFPRFTSWLGHNSSSGKQRRLLGELHTRMVSSDAPAVDRTELRLYYLPALKGALTRPLVEREKEGIPEVVDAMHEYCLERDDLEFLADVTKFKTKGGWSEDPFKAVPAAVKSAFTRAFNAAGGKAKSSLQLDEVKGLKKKKKKAPGGGGGGMGGEMPLKEEEAEAAEAAAEVDDEGGAGGESDEEDDDLPPDAKVLAQQRKLARSGVQLTLKESGKAKKGSGRGSSKASGGRGSGAAGRGRGSGAGRGRGKK